MKRQLLPMLLAGVLAAPFLQAETQQQGTTQDRRQAEELRSSQAPNQATTFELRQEREERTVVRPETRVQKDTELKVETSPQAAALSDTAQVISLRETPEPVRRHIERQAAFVPLQSIVRQTQNGQTVYEANFMGAKVQSKLLLSEAGVPLNLHVSSAAPVVYEGAGAQRPTATQPPAPAQMSQQAMNRLQQQIGSAQVRAVQPRTIYEVTVEANGQSQQIWVAEDGSIMR